MYAPRASSGSPSQSLPRVGEASLAWCRDRVGDRRCVGVLLGAFRYFVIRLGGPPTAAPAGDTADRHGSRFLMPIVVRIDIELAKRKMSVGEFSERVGLTPANVAVLKNGRAKAVRFSTLEAMCRCSTVSPATCSSGSRNDPRWRTTCHAMDTVSTTSIRSPGNIGAGSASERDTP